MLITKFNRVIALFRAWPLLVTGEYAMNRNAIIAISALVISAITSPALAAGTTQKHRAYDAGAYASAAQVQPGSLAEQRWFDRASSPRND
jgi:hypothetical protein